MTAATDALLPWQRPAFARIEDALDRGRLGHALLLDGPRGWGKRFLARQLGRRLLDLPLAGAHPPAWGDVEADQDLLRHPDCRIMAPTFTDAGKRRSQIRVDEVREANEFLARTAGSGAHRVLLVELAEQLNVSAANALLKRLEEPGRGTHILLVTHAPGRVLATIRSRCQRVPLPADAGAAGAWLASVTAADPEQQAWALDLAAGAPLLALEYLEGEGADLARDIAAGLDGGSPSALAAAWAGQDMALVLDLLYRLLAMRARATAGGDLAALRMLERVGRARRGLLSQSNPNPTLLLEDLLAGWRQLLARTG